MQLSRTSVGKVVSNIISEDGQPAMQCKRYGYINLSKKNQITLIHNFQVAFK